MSTIISSQITDIEGAKVDLDGEKIELTIDIGTVFILLHGFASILYIIIVYMFYLVK